MSKFCYFIVHQFKVYWSGIHGRSDRYFKKQKPYFPMMHDNKDLESFCYLLATKFYNHFQKLEDFQKIIFQK